MLIRALIVLLLVLNLGVAAWWLTRAPSPPEPATPTPTVPQLELVAAGEPVPAATAASEAEPTNAPTTLERCASFGPFASTNAAADARQRVLALSARVRLREMTAGPYRGWKVWLPPYPTAAAVEAVSERVAAAGFNDRFVVREGRDANSLALGRFASEAPARQHAAALVAAGFPAQAEPIGSGRIQHWLDVAARPDDVAQVRRLADAPEARELDCATWQ